MEPESKYCGNCGCLNTRKSHWRIGRVRLCSITCYDAYAEKDIKEKSDEINGTKLLYVPRNPAWGSSPRQR